MPLPTIANTIRTSIEGTMPNGHKFAFVWHHRKDGGLSFAAAIAILDPKVFAFFNSALAGGVAFKGFAATTWALTQIRYTPLDNSTATTVVSHALAGTVASEPLPANVALVSTFRTATRGRSFRGRTYLAGFTEAANAAGGVPDSTNLTNLQTQWAGYLASLVGSGVSLVVASYKLAVATDVASITTDNRWDTQRRRLNT